MTTREVPRNIDRANRNAEYAMVFLGVYYGFTGLFSEPLLGFVLGLLSIHITYKLTVDRPEGQAFRFIYRYIRIGYMIPAPKFAKKFEI